MISKYHIYMDKYFTNSSSITIFIYLIKVISKCRFTVKNGVRHYFKLSFGACFSNFTRGDKPDFTQHYL